MANLMINGKNYDLQDFVTSMMKLLMRANAISQNELRNLQDTNYCQQTFNLHFPLLSSNPSAFNSDSSHSRYYIQSTFFEQNLYLCNHWYDDNADLYLNWFLSILPNI